MTRDVGWIIEDWTPLRSKIFFSTPKLPHDLQSPLVLLLEDYEAFSLAKAVRA